MVMGGFVGAFMANPVSQRGGQSQTPAYLGMPVENKYFNEMAA
jgi:hypothetical protein